MDKVNQAIQRLKTASEMSLAVYEKPLIICDSGGKDSSVLTDLAIRAKIPCEIQHSHTTADAPETVRFVRKKFHDLECAGHHVTIDYPMYKGKRVSMWTLIPQKLMAPTRRARYCCEIIKEGAGNGRMCATGVRKDESTGRSDRGIYETVNKDKERRVILLNDNDDRRQLFENCKLKSARVVNPIIDYSENDVWAYIRDNKVPYNPCYNCGFSRVGCIGCPMAGRKGRLREFAIYPQYEQMYRRAFARIIKIRRERGLKTFHTSSEEVFLWWMEDPNVAGQISMDELTE